MDKTIRKILEADIYDLVQETPLTKAPRLSAKVGRGVLLKREDLQEIFSFKVRGAYNLMRQLPQAARVRGVITASAGNHAQGVALAGQTLNIPVTIVMGVNTPAIKRDAVKARGARSNLLVRIMMRPRLMRRSWLRARIDLDPALDHEDVIADRVRSVWKYCAKCVARSDRYSCR